MIHRAAYAAKKLKLSLRNFQVNAKFQNPWKTASRRKVNTPEGRERKKRKMAVKTLVPPATPKGRANTSLGCIPD